MCGIVGLTDNNNFHLLSRMNELLTYRGPDGRGEYLNENKGIALAMRRLSIIDLESGRQPMANEDESLWTVCNGEIYNSPELRKRLQDSGHRFRTNNSDVEVLLHLYEEKGKNMLKDLNGMFAFVLYDEKKNILFGARDRIGIKPLYYSCKDGKFAFASELKSLSVLPWISKDINFNSVYHYISLQFIPAPNSIFSDIQKLPAGHFFIYDLTRKHLTTEKYWDMDVNHIENKPLDYWVKILRLNLEEAVKRWTLSDVPIACSLSGGLDSSSIVGLLAKSGAADLRTYSLGFSEEEEQEFSELSLARKVAEKWGTEHHEVILEAGQVLKDIEKMVWHLDEPYGGGLPSWYIYNIIGKDVKVALTGTGGDELFGNYGKYSIYEKSKMYRWFKIGKDAVKHHSIGEIRDGFKYPVGHFYHRYMSDAFKDEIIFDHNQAPDIKTEALIEQTWNQSRAENPRNAVAYMDFKMQLPEEFLLVTDRFSMAHSVEARVPFLDHTLVELVYRIPPEIRTQRDEPKYLLKKVIGELLPKELLTAPKRGFVLPLNVWTRKELKHLVEEKLSPEYLKKQDIFSTKVYNKIVKPHLDRKKDYTQQVWTMLMFQLWHERYCEAGN